MAHSKELLETLKMYEPIVRGIALDLSKAKPQDRGFKNLQLDIALDGELETMLTHDSPYGLKVTQFSTYGENRFVIGLEQNTPDNTYKVILGYFMRPGEKVQHEFVYDIDRGDGTGWNYFDKKKYKMSKSGY